MTVLISSINLGIMSSLQKKIITLGMLQHGLIIMASAWFFASAMNFRAVCKDSMALLRPGKQHDRQVPGNMDVRNDLTTSTNPSVPGALSQRCLAFAATHGCIDLRLSIANIRLLLGWMSNCRYLGILWEMHFVLCQVSLCCPAFSTLLPSIAFSKAWQLCVCTKTNGQFKEELNDKRASLQLVTGETSCHTESTVWSFLRGLLLFETLVFPLVASVWKKVLGNPTLKLEELDSLHLYLPAVW